MKSLLNLAILLSATFFSFAFANETNQYSFFNDSIAIELSSKLNQLSDSSIKKRYGKQQTPPTYAFEDNENSVSFTFTQYPTPANKSSMNKIHKSISNMLRKASDKASWKKDKVYTRLGTKIAVYEYEVKGIGKYQYNLTYALPIEGRLTFISFKTTNKKYKNKWLAVARESLDSIQLTNNT
ncbi:hypothetical protein HII17_13620 [Thalassotalea sp. M1531]|uniref:PsbP C-terminal domain-containing protein n=1 Tax=Thalassotalea algicola TaxID=2716224 RepID=A0A7Y0Q8X2_9GAMM|nr:hypothetical protein [Thalassotalea algicola]NMP32600.1 hypothetical protein [Thalassotalea algicola]